MRVIWAPVALDRAVEIAATIARDDPTAARQWVSELFDRAATLKDFPDRGRMVPEVGRETIRELLVGRYRVIYRRDSNRKVVMTVRHQRQRWIELESGGRWADKVET